VAAPRRGRSDTAVLGLTAHAPVGGDPQVATAETDATEEVTA
jgi:hypothetical protein